MDYLKYIFLLVLTFSAFFAEGQTANKDGPVEIEISVDIVPKDGKYIVKLQDNPAMFYLYIISDEPIPELQDKELFVNIVDSEEHGWPVLEAGYIDTRYGRKEFLFDLRGKSFYLLATNGEDYSKVSQFDFR